VGPAAAPVPGTTAPTAPTGSTVPAAPTGSPRTTDCFADPEACGYPGPNTTGPGGEGEAKCASYPEGGAVTISTPGEVKEKRFTEVTVRAANVTLNDVCIVGSGHPFTVLNDYEGGSNFTIENSVIRGTGEHGSETIEAALWDSETFSPPPRAINDLMRYCGECIHGAWNVQNSYAITDSYFEGQHTEDWFTYGDNVAEHDTLLNPHGETGVFEGSGTSVLLKNSLIGGGGWSIYSESGGSSFQAIGNRIARRVCTKGIEHGSSGEYTCLGTGTYGEGTDGYWPFSGAYGLITGSVSKWEGNYWDDNLQAVQKSATGK
jgi:hypothetical protein